MIALQDSIRDPWRAAQLGAGFKKISVAFRGILYGFLFFLVLGYMSHLIAGNGPRLVWGAYGFFPGIPGADPWSAPYLLWVSGIIGGVLTVMVGAAGVAKLTYRQLKGDDFYGSSDAWNYAVSRGPSTLGTPVLLGLLALAVLLALWVMGLLGRLPVIGPALIGILALPALLAAAMGLFVVAGLGTSLVYGPAVVGCTGEDALEGTIQCMGLIWSHPWRMAAYTITLATSTLLAGALAAVFALNAVLLGGTVLSWGMGSAIQPVLATAASYLPRWSVLGGLVQQATPSALSRGFTYTAFEFPGSTIWVHVGGLLTGILLLVVMGIVLAYVVSSLYSGAAAAYLSLRRFRDNEDLLGWQDEIDQLENRAHPAAS